MTNPVGRPTDYKSEHCNKVDEYLKTTGKEHTSLPKIVSFARFLGFSKSTLYEWAEKYPEFSDALVKVMAAQEEQLVDDGIYGGKEINASIVKLMLEHNHGMVGAEKKIMVGESDKPITIKVVYDGDETINKKLPEAAVDL